MTAEVTITPWPEESSPTQPAIRRRFDEEGLHPYPWSNGPGDFYPAHSHSYRKVIYVVNGTITFGLPDRGEALSLRPGDRLDLPAGIRHDAIVGPEGVRCLEAHLK